MTWLWLGLATAALAAPVEKQLTFQVVPASATVKILSDRGFDLYPVGRPVMVKLPANQFDLELSAPDWKSARIPINANALVDRWPVEGGAYRLQPDGWRAYLSLYWPWIPGSLIGLAVVAWAVRQRRRAPAPSSPWDLPSGSWVGDYQVLDRLGEGASAVVFRVRSRHATRDEADAALKLFRPDTFRAVDQRPRFLREMKALARLSHPHIPTLYDYGEFQGQLYLVMEYLGQTSLKEKLESGPIPVPEAQKIFAQILSALEFAHKQGVLHRDVKPDNVVFGRDGLVRLVDFGLARAADQTTVTQEGAMLGTPAYIAPEVVHGRPATALSDQYSLGCLGFELWSGRCPFLGESSLAVAVQHVSVPPPDLQELRPDAPSAAVAALAKMMSKDPSDRFADLSAVAAALPAD